jgi:outer membrane protein OmpA-like peptidoglycan-associated protein
MIRHRLAPLGLALSLLANAAWGGGVVMYQANERPSPRDVASILARSPQVPPGLKMRSIRMLPAEETPPEAPRAPERLTSAPAEAPTVLAAVDPEPAPKASPAPRPSSDDVPSSLALPIQFAFDSARIMPSAYSQIDAVAAGIKLVGPGVKVVIEGHTDAIGSGEYNLKLSSQRADAVRTYLITHHGIQPARLRVVGMGKYAPLNRHSPTAPENRRVEFRAEG